MSCLLVLWPVLSFGRPTYWLQSQIPVRGPVTTSAVRLTERCTRSRGPGRGRGRGRHIRRPPGRLATRLRTWVDARAGRPVPRPSRARPQPARMVRAQPVADSDVAGRGHLGVLVARELADELQEGPGSDAAIVITISSRW